MQRDDPFEVVLREPAATGHRWRLANVPPQVKVIDDRYEPPPGGPLGGAGRRIVTLRATDPGNHRVKFELAREWETEPADEHYVDVDAS